MGVFVAHRRGTSPPFCDTAYQSIPVFVTPHFAHPVFAASGLNGDPYQSMENLQHTPTGLANAKAELVGISSGVPIFKRDMLTVHFLPKKSPLFHVINHKKERILVGCIPDWDHMMGVIAILESYVQAPRSHPPPSPLIHSFTHSQVHALRTPRPRIDQGVLGLHGAARGVQAVWRADQAHANDYCSCVC